MRSASVLAFSGLAAAAIVPVYEVPSDDYEVISSAPADETFYSTKLVTITSCEADVPCPAESTVISSSEIPYTTSVVYETKVYTVTDCGEEVVDCPGKTGYEVTETIAVSTTICPVDEATPTPEYPEPSHDEEYPEPSGDVYPPPTEEETSKTYPVEEPSVYPPPGEETYPPAPHPTEPAEEPCVEEVVEEVTKTKVITTTIESVYVEKHTKTVEADCPAPSAPSATYPVPPVYPSGNATVPTPEEPIPTGPSEAGAAGVSGSVFLAGLAAIAAYAFA